MIKISEVGVSSSIPHTHNSWIFNFKITQKCLIDHACRDQSLQICEKWRCISFGNFYLIPILCSDIENRAWAFLITTGRNDKYTKL